MVQFLLNHSKLLSANETLLSIWVAASSGLLLDGENGIYYCYNRIPEQPYIRTSADILLLCGLKSRASRWRRRDLLSFLTSPLFLHYVVRIGPTARTSLLHPPLASAVRLTSTLNHWPIWKVESHEILIRVQLDAPLEYYQWSHSIYL